MRLKTDENKLVSCSLEPIPDIPSISNAKRKKILHPHISAGINKIQPTKYVHRRDVAALFAPVRRARILFMSCTLSLLIPPIFVRSAGQNGEVQHVLTRARRGPLGVPRRPFAFALKINPLLPRTFMHEWQRCRDLM